MYKLYYRKGTGVIVVQAVLEECSVEYEKIVVENPKSAEFLAVNPMGAIPALGLPDGSVMTESAAIVLHIADTNPNSNLMPALGSSERAHAYRWLLFLATSGYGAALRRFRAAQHTTDPACVGAIEEAAARDLHRYFSVIDAAIKEGPFLFGGMYTGVDAYLWMLAAWQPDRDQIYADNPKLKALVDEVVKRPSMARIVEEHDM